MKLLIPSLLFTILSLAASAQGPTVTTIHRGIQFRTMGKDSIDLNLNENYQVIEDSCSVIIRHAHLNLRERKFTGKFTDVNKANPSIILSSGNYGSNGLKTGEFVSYNLDGTLRSKGRYTNGKFDGKWEINYSNGKPAVVFTANNDTVKIESAWDKQGKKIVDNGKGSYMAIQAPFTWKGKLENGKPNGTWVMYRTDDATETPVIEESFKKGQFQKAVGTFQNYNDASRIQLISAQLLPYLNAEGLAIAPPCNSSFGKHIVGAQYENGLQLFTTYISDNVKPALSKFNLSAYTGVLDLEGDVSEKGAIENLRTPDPFNMDLATALTRALYRLPALHPATIDGKPVKQSFVITFKFFNGMYNFTYRFLPIKA